jgi:hypothetical protein
MGNEELKEIFDAWKTKIREEKQKEGGIEIMCVCICVLLARCLSSVCGWDFGTVCFGWPPSQRTPGKIRTDVWQMKTLPPETA